MGIQRRWSGRRTVRRMFLAVGVMGVVVNGCARLPYDTRTIHEDERIVVTLQKEVQQQFYSHPMHITPTDWASLLRGFSIREKQRLPLRWFQEETPPKQLFREDEILLLAPYLAEGMQQVRPDERVHFAVRMPGHNPRSHWDVLGGWVAAQDPYLHLIIEYFHVQIPMRRSDIYDADHVATPPPPPREYLLYFEPGRFWIRDDRGRRAVDYRRYLKSGESGPGSGPGLSPSGAP